MKKIIIILALLAVAIIGALAVLPFLIPAETYKREVAAQVKKLTGRDLVIEGDAKVSVWPALGVSLNRVTLSNPSGFSAPVMALVEKMTVEVALAPLLSKQVEVKSFILERPVIRLEKNAQGKANWDFSTESASAPASANQKQESSSSTPLALTLGEIKIKNGEVSYVDAKSKASYAAKGVNATLAMPSLGSRASLSLDMEYNKERVDLKLDVERPLALTQGEATPLKVNLNAASLAKLSFDGKLSMLGAEGALDFASPSIPKLAAWGGSGFDWKAKAPLAVSIKGALKCGLSQCTANKATVAVDDIRGEADAAFAWGGRKPSVALSLKTGAVDVGPYLSQAQPGFSLISQAQAAEWSNDTVDFSGLNTVDAKINATLESLTYNDMKIAPLNVNALLESGRLRYNVPEAGIYGGKLKAEGVVDAGGTLALKLQARGVQAEPMLKRFADFDRLSGALEADMDVKTSGASQRQWVSNLGGQGRVRFTDGAIKGINLAQMARNLKTAFTDTGEAQKTDFSELGGSFTIAQGVVSNNDLAMKAPLLRVTGAGTVNLPQQSVNYRLVPQLVGSLAGQGGTDAQGVAVPILVTGTFDKLSFTPDVQSIVQDVLKDPEKAKEQLKNIKEQFKEGKGDVKEQLKELKNDPAALNNLLQGLGR